MQRLEGHINVRVFEDIIEEAKEQVNKHPDLYENFSHYVRAALIRLNNYHKGREHGKFLD